MNESGTIEGAARPVDPLDIPVDAQPFLRWAGGKRQLLPALLANLPVDLDAKVYVEPFLGAGSLFFAVGPENAILGDANESLMSTYAQLRDNPSGVLRELKQLIKKHSVTHYYDVRNSYNSAKPSARQAARLIYLNKTCFNGIFRVNRAGAFNVPKGSKDKLMTPSVAQFLAISAILAEADLRWEDYKETLSLARTGDFVYLDPPYPALNDTAFFTHYTSSRFDQEAQKALAVEVKKLDNRGVLFLMSNADTPLIKELYSGFSQEAVPVRRYISSNGSRAHASELLIKNY